jgi:hypothetical protein
MMLQLLDLVAYVIVKMMASRFTEPNFCFPNYVKFFCGKDYVSIHNDRV